MAESEMVRRVAKAVCEADVKWFSERYPEVPYSILRESVDGELSGNYAAIARAAIEAMRNPTSEMIEVGHANIAPWWSRAMEGTQDYGNTRKAAASSFAGMIDAALQEDTQ